MIIKTTLFAFATLLISALSINASLGDIDHELVLSNLQLDETYQGQDGEIQLAKTTTEGEA